MDHTHGLPASADTESRELLPALADVPGHLLWRAHARVSQALADLLPADADIHSYRTLKVLKDGTPRSQQEIADLLLTSRTTMARVAADLADRGLVERVRNPADRRSYALTRTPEGARAAGRWKRHTEAVEPHVTASFTRAERDDLRALLQRLLTDDEAPSVHPDRTRSLGFLVAHVHTRMHRAFLAALTPLGLEPRLFGALTTLTATGPISQAALARHLGVSGPSTVEIADALEDRGLVERRRDPGDRRSQLLHLTDAAPGVLAEAQALERRSHEEQLGVLSPAELHRLVGLLRRVVTGG